MKCIHKRPFSYFAMVISMCLMVGGTNFIAWGQEGEGGGGNDGQTRVAVFLDAAQYSSEDLAEFMLDDGQSWRPNRKGDAGGRGQAGSHTFYVKKGNAYRLTAHAIEAINPNDGMVSLWWNIWAENGVLVNGQTPKHDTPLNAGGHPMPEPDYTIVAPIIAIHTITFSGDYQQALVADPGVAADYNAPHWLDWDMSGSANDHAWDRRIPIAFASQGPQGEDSRATLATTLSVIPDIELTVIQQARLRIKAQGPTDALNFPPTVALDCVWDVLSQVCEANNHLSPFEKQVALWTRDELHFSWMYTFDKDCQEHDASCWLDAGQSDHLMYITYKPALAPNEHPLYHSLVHLGCEAAAGATDDDTVLREIWEKGFKPLDIRRVNRNGEKETSPLTYYGTYEHSGVNSPVTDTKGLLTYRDGTCDALAKFFIDALKIQGLRYKTYLVKLEDADKIIVFLVNKWNFSGQPTGQDQDYPYRLVPENPFVTQRPGNIPDYAYCWKEPLEIIDESGIKAQGNNDPDSIFAYHQIVAISESNQSYDVWLNHYDPSYGQEYSTLGEVGTSIAGYGYGVGPGQGFYFRPNSNSSLGELEWETKEY